jgi:tetratricopeptide (TPR) repeat protein
VTLPASGHISAWLRAACAVAAAAVCLSPTGCARLADRESLEIALGKTPLAVVHFPQDEQDEVAEPSPADAANASVAPDSAVIPAAAITDSERTSAHRVTAASYFEELTPPAAEAAEREYPVRQTAGENPLSEAGRAISGGFHKLSDNVTGAFSSKPDPPPPSADPTRLATETGDFSPDLYVSAALLAASQNNFDAAEQRLEQALAESPRNLNALLTLSRIKHRRGKVNEAIRIALLAAHYHPNNAVAHNDLGLCLARAGQYDAAIRAIRRAMELAPRAKRYPNNLAAVMVDARQTNEAHRVLCTVHPRSVACYNLGYLLNRAGRPDEARAQFTAALREDPHLTAAHTMLAKLGPTSREPSRVAGGLPPRREEAPRFSSVPFGDQATSQRPSGRVLSISPRPAESPRAPVGLAESRPAPPRPQPAALRPLTANRYSTEYPGSRPTSPNSPSAPASSSAGGGFAPQPPRSQPARTTWPPAGSSPAVQGLREAVSSPGSGGLVPRAATTAPPAAPAGLRGPNSSGPAPARTLLEQPSSAAPGLNSTPPGVNAPATGFGPAEGIRQPTFNHAPAWQPGSSSRGTSLNRPAAHVEAADDSRSDTADDAAELRQPDISWAVHVAPGE